MRISESLRWRIESVDAFHVKHEGAWVRFAKLIEEMNRRSFPDAEVPEDLIEHVLDINAASQPAKRARSQPQLFGDQLFLVRLQRTAERIDSMLQCNTMPLARDDDRFTPTEGVAGKRRQSSDQGIHALS